MFIDGIVARLFPAKKVRVRRSKIKKAAAVKATNGASNELVS
jgi:hypothetical protein